MKNIVDKYNELTNQKHSFNNIRVQTHIPTPGEIDYKRGYITRFFCQKSNDKGSPIYEVSSIQFSKYLSNPFYRLVSLDWRIKGPKETQYSKDGNILDKSVSESNRIAIELVSTEIPNLKLYLPNLLQFYKS